ncbi:hypothetical protein [Gordonia soli]|uniref:Uncharacterized protein n=1 Tax=Gordonia soli NBRC 108243 TaxID=1223545 RepID=M0QKN0_9ACTN|nr:hypothetical protein [Gordonia soli]GAC67977.1 hypothetical protein GS4_11_02480 [Gordonia soli NBRC 108243]
MWSVAVFHALVVMNLLFVTGAWCLARPSVPAAAVLVAVSVLWLFANGPIEGGILYSFSVEHGLTESDVLSVIGFVLAAVSVWRVRRSPWYR